MHPEWWWWVVGGIALILAELAIPAFVLIWFGMGALGVSLLVALIPILDLTMQLFIWLLISTSLVIAWFKIFKPSLHKTRVGRSAANIIGECGLLTHDVAPFQKGEVRFQKPMVGSDVWPCISDATITTGERVRVLAVEGNLLKVGKL